MGRATLGSIITRAHRLADIPEASSSRTDAVASVDEMIDEANSGLAELHDVIVEQWEDYFTVSADITMTANTSKVLLPDDFYKLRTIYATVDADQRRQLHPWQMQEVGQRRVTEAWEFPDYRIIGKYIEWLPEPSATRTVTLYYLRQFFPLEETTDEISPEVPRGWEDFVVGHLAEYLLDKRELDPTPGVRRKELARRRIMKSAAQRNASEPARTIDVNSRYFGYRRRRLNLPYPKV